jgi:glycosyltransferase involved in cell wall biosynthesis
MPEVSVIIPCYNLGQYLDEAVDSVLDQTYQDFEIIIVNDGSSDEFTNTLLKDYSKPKCTVYATSNQGLPAARNYGIERANGQYICCLDADDKYHPEFLEKCIKVLDEDKKDEFGFVTTWVQLFGNQNGIWETEDYNPYKLVFENQIHVASLFRKVIWEKVNGYSTNLSGYQDWDFWLKIVAKGYKWALIKEPLFLYRSRHYSMISDSDKKRTGLRRTILQNNLEFLKKHPSEIILEYDKLINKCMRDFTECHVHTKETESRLQQTESRLQQTELELLKIYNSRLYRVYKLLTLPVRIFSKSHNKTPYEQ